MSDVERLKQLIGGATEERLRELVSDWLDKDAEFRAFVEQELSVVGQFIPLRQRA